MKPAFLLALMILGCASKKAHLPASTELPLKEVKSFRFTPYPQIGDASWLEPSSTGEPFEKMELDPIVFQFDGKNYWMAGALKEGSMVRRSFLFQSVDGFNWVEKMPASSGVAIVAFSPGVNGGWAAIESYWTEGTYLVSAWVSDRVDKWKNIIFQRENDWEKDPIRKDLKCCSEMVRSFKITATGWEVELEGSEKVAKYNSKNFGRTWQLQKKSLRDLEPNFVLDRGWLRADWDGPVSLVEISMGGRRFVFPKFWKFLKKKNKLYLDPILWIQ